MWEKSKYSGPLQNTTHEGLTIHIQFQKILKVRNTQVKNISIFIWLYFLLCKWFEEIDCIPKTNFFKRNLNFLPKIWGVSLVVVVFFC